jgi:hypothetical protein
MIHTKSVYCLKDLAEMRSRAIVLDHPTNGSEIAGITDMFEANLLYFELQGNEWFFWQRIKERGYDALIARIPSGIAGLAQTGDILSVIEEMKRQRMLQFTVNLQPPAERIIESLMDVGVTAETITEYMIRVMQIESGDLFEVEKQSGKYFVISGLSPLEKQQLNTTGAQPRLLTQDRTRNFAVFGKDFLPPQADFRKYTF